jgi:hypothetical protein
VKNWDDRKIEAGVSYNMIFKKINEELSDGKTS